MRGARRGTGIQAATVPDLRPHHAAPSILRLSGSGLVRARRDLIHIDDAGRDEKERGRAPPINFKSSALCGTIRAGSGLRVRVSELSCASSGIITQTIDVDAIERALLHQQTGAKITLSA